MNQQLETRAASCCGCGTNNATSKEPAAPARSQAQGGCPCGPDCPCGDECACGPDCPCC